MKAKLRIVSAACLLAAAALCAAFFGVHARPAASLPQAQEAALSRTQSVCADPAAILFPELCGMPVTSLTISTPERSFQFQLDKQGAVSVNGQQADGEVFSTLLSQIALLPVERFGDFNPQAQNLILTLVVSTGQGNQTARFYEDGGAGEKAHIVLDPEHAPQYLQTSGWRVGTLMMTCEGTRILDAHGNETPATL